MESGSPRRGGITLRQQMVSSSFGALTTSVLVTPMDVVKIRLQRQVRPLSTGECFVFTAFKHSVKCEWFNRPGHFNGMFDAFAKIARNEGILSLWSGLSPTMLSAVPATIFYFTLYENILTRLRRRVGNEFYVPLASGSTARAIAVTVVSPLELVRTKMQSQRHTYSELKHAIKATVAYDGYSALWRGWAATMLREIPFSGIYWSCYEYFKSKALRELKRTNTSLPIALLCGASAGSIAVVLTMPFDVIKTQQQITLGSVGPVQNSSSSQTSSNGKPVQSPVPRPSPLLIVMKDLVEKRGPSSLFTGLIPRLARVGPSCAIMIASYEYFKQFFQTRNDLRASE